MDRVRKLDAENIIVVTNNIKITVEAVEENRAAVRAFIQDMQGPIVLVIDYREAETSFNDILEMIQRNQAGSRADLNERVFSIFVGTDKFLHMYRESMGLPQFGGNQVPCFSDIDVALAAARLYIERESRSKD